MALGSVAVSVVPDSVEREVLVVVNGSQDQTREVSRSFAGSPRPSHGAVIP